MFSHRLCLALGRWDSPSQMLDALTIEEYQDWKDYYSVDPFGEVRADRRMARLCYAVQQPHTKRQLRESIYMLDYRPALPLSEGAFRDKADRIFGRLNKLIR